MRKRLAFESLESRELLAADLLISEFMASNGGVLEDGDGAASDWIEIYNNGDASANLQGYSLTDDPGDLNKWSFSTPTILAPGQFLVVFASGEDKVDSAGAVHTNFSLASDGEYVALVDPGGVVLSEFGPSGAEYPPQISNVSYGVAFDSSSPAVVTPESSARYLVPSNASVDGAWMQPGFNDAGWQAGVASLGYETSGTNYANAGLLDTVLPSGTTTAYVRIPFTVDGADTLLSKLQMKYDDGFIAYINGTRVAGANDPSSPGYDSTATDEHPDGAAVNYVDFDVSSFSHLLVEGENVLAVHMLNRSSGSSDLLAAVNLLTTSGGLIEPVVVGALQSPTPGLPNTNLRASDVQFSHTGGPFVSSFQLTLATADNSEVIRYTTNGSAPTASSPLYTGPLLISDTTQVRARAFGPVGQVGGVHTESYTRTDAATGAFTSDLPIIVLENFGAGTPGTGDFEDAVLSLHEVDESTGRASLGATADLSTLIGQHRRGRSTAGNPKTNLRIEIRDENGEDKNVELLGMPSESDWILYAPYNFDRAMIRNATFFELSRQMGKWAPRVRFVEVYANYDGDQLDAGDYMGVYVLMENIKRDGDRVYIEELTPTQNSEPDITGGYIFALDGPDGETPPDGAWKTDRNIPTLGDSWLVHEEPGRLDMTQAQVDYLRGYIQDFEDALYGPNSTDPELGYQAYFEVDTSIDHHILRVLSKEPDGLRLSTFLTKDRDGKIAFGPVWDFDRSSGADDDSRSSNPEGWFLPDVDFFESDWWGPLFDDPNFAQRWVDRWQELRQGVLSDDGLRATVNGLASQIAEAQVRNFQEWPNIAPNGGTYADPGLTGWEAEVSHLANWLVIRANWMDEQLINLPAFSPAPGNTSPGQQVTLTATLGADIYYTLDGTDPRADGGGISPNAIEYTGPITINDTTQINARAFGVPGTSVSGNSSYPGNERPSDALDGNSGTKYLNFGGANSGIILTPGVGASVVRSFQLTTANDAQGRDPSSWELYGTNDPIQSNDNSTGLAENWTLIDSGSINLPTQRQTQGPVVSVDNATAYTSYKLMFPTLKFNANEMQVADIRFYETSNGTGAQILAPGDGALAVHVQTGPGAEGISPWSSLVTGLFSVELPADASSLRISELHYHPADPTADELLVVPGAEEDDFEFIELVNTSSNPISLNGVQLGGGITFDFTTGSVTSLAPGQAVVVVVENAEAFAARYGAGIAIAGQYGGKLGNGGDQVTLTDSGGATIHDFTYDDSDPWAEAADGDGPSLEAIDLFGDHTQASNWRASAANGGTPGVHTAATLPGDYDNSGAVDQADYAVWRASYGSTTDLAADGNNNGRVDTADYTVWRDNLDAVLAPPVVAAAAPTTHDGAVEAVPSSTAMADASEQPATVAAYPIENTPVESALRPTKGLATTPAASNAASDELLLLDLAYSSLQDDEWTTPATAAAVDGEEETQPESLSIVWRAF
ncbi:CotH kinase family protein [Posidoniimonas corsicana]|nr:CotH kinase family protein [Posidoniimonas corsicana]